MACSSHEWVVLLYFHDSYLIYLFLDTEKFDRFYHLYCRFCVETVMPKIWKNADLLPEDISVQNLMMKWDVLPTSWLQNDILGCILPNKPGKILLQSICQKSYSLGLSVRNHLLFHFTDRSKLNHPENNHILPIISNELQYKRHFYLHNNYCLKLFLTQDMTPLDQVDLDLIYYQKADIFKNILGELTF